MAVPPKPPHLRAPAAVADHGRKISRLEGSRDALVSQMNQTAPQAAQALTTANSAQTGVNGINTRLGAANMAFLQTLSVMPHIANPSGGFARSGVGTISGTVTAAEYNALNGATNNAIDGLNLLVSKVMSLLAELQAANLMS